MFELAEPRGTDYSTGCRSREWYETYPKQYSIVENLDGTVSIYDNGTPITNHETKPCCEALGYEFDIENQKCRWATDLPCDGNDDMIKVIVNPEGNFGSLFNVDENETCCLDISFDYLFKFDCETILEQSGVPEVPKDVLALQEQLQALEKECKYYEDRLNELGAIPFVIQCEGAVAVDPTGELGTNLDDSYYDNSGSDNPPLALSPTLQPSSYCLTDAGLVQWEIILGSATYNLWLASLGKDTTFYTCEQVQQLTNNSPAAPNEWYTSPCDYTILDKSLAEEERIKLRRQLSSCQEKLNEIRNQIALLTPVQGPNECWNYIEVFENFDVSFTLEALNPDTNTLETVYEETLINVGTGNLYDYILSASGQTGFMISGDTGVLESYGDIIDPCGDTKPSECFKALAQPLASQIYEQYLSAGGTKPTTEDEKNELFTTLTSWYQSCWLRYENKICEPAIISQIENKDVNISIKINNNCVDFSILLDRIKLVKECTKIDNVETFISEPPKFEFVKLCDNKKSWLVNREPDERFFDLKYRGTEYNTNHHRLVINTKEVDLNLSPARAVEQDVWCYLSDNPCILDCSTGTTSVTCETNIDFAGILLNNAVECEGCGSTGGTATGLTSNLVTNGTFDTDLSGWTIDPAFNSWVWNPLEIADYNGTDEGGTLSQDILETGCTYQISFDVYFSGVAAPQLIVNLGSNQYDLSSTIVSGNNSISFSGVATGSTVFSISAYDDGGVGLQYLLDNVEVLKYVTVNTGSCISACTVTSLWNIDVILGCETIYSNNSFYAGSGISDVPTEADYITELNNIANELGLLFTSGATGVTFTDVVDCEGTRFINKNFKVDLGLDITVNCELTKQFQDLENFQFQDGEDYDFN
jgi:hypothetical protein